MNKKKIALIASCAIGLTAIAVATPLLVTSCSDINPNTENITTFADAVKFTNNFFKENYTFDMLKKDFQNYANNFSSIVSNDNFKATLTINPSLNGNKLNLKVNLNLL